MYRYAIVKIDSPNATLVVADFYHSWLTGLVLSLITHKGNEIAAKFIFKLFRYQHHKNFLPGLEKLNLTDLPDAVAAAQYHYFSNQLGGVKVEYLKVSDKKAWIRYPPPRWIWAGTAICAIPGIVNEQMMRGWHAHNGVSLENPRLGFVCTKTTVGGQPGLEGYYLEYDKILTEDERLRFSSDESCPYIDPQTLPVLDQASWPEIRRSKAYRNYAMEYIRNALPIFIELLGEKEALRLGELCALQIGMQCYDNVVRGAGLGGDDEEKFMQLLEFFFSGSGDQWSRNKTSICVQTPTRISKNLDMSYTLKRLLNAPLEGLLAAHNRFLKLKFYSDNTFSVVKR